MFGCRIHPIPLDFAVCETAENALAWLPEFDPPVAGHWAGYIPAPERYEAIYRAAAAKGVLAGIRPRSIRPQWSSTGSIRCSAS